MSVKDEIINGVYILKGRDYYKPFDFPWAFELWEKHESIHWLPSEVNFETDVRDWKHNLTEGEKDFLTQLFRFFTQADVQVNAGYSGIFLPAFNKYPELNFLMSSIAAREGVHVISYSQLLDTVGMPETEYQAFHEYEAMQEKYDYVEGFDKTTPEGLAKCCAVYGAFVEGLQLFSSFAMLLNFGRFGKMSGMIDIVAWSMRDESIHVDTLVNCYHELVKMYPDEIDQQKINQEVRDICKKMVELEDKFIDLAFQMDGVPGLKAEEVKAYIRYIADYRLDQLGIVPEYHIKKDPLPWIDELVNGTEHANFFERRGTEYGKGNVQGSIDEIDWDDLDS